MDLRVTPRLAIDFATSELGRQSAELQRTQQQISTGIRLHRPSDDPAAVRRSIVQKDQLSRLDTHADSVRHSKSRASAAHVQLREAQQLLVRARELAITGAQVTDEAALGVYASELDGILNRLASIANATDDTGYLFAGTATGTEPFAFDFSRTTGTATYQGTSASSFLRLTGDVDREALIAGDEVFQQVLREPTIFLGNTGLRSGIGTDTATGFRTLTVAHTSTTYAAGSGVAAGTSSVSGDTIVGASGTHQLQIVDTSGTGAFGTISLNNGGPVEFTSADTDLKVTGPNGELVYVDLSTITAGFNGTVDLVADGTLSIDGGTTTQPILFTGNDIVTDPADGSTIHLDTTAMVGTGDDTAEFVGTNDVFDTLVALKNDLLNTSAISSEERTAALDRRLGDIERVEDHLLNEIGIQSVVLEQIENLLVRTEDQTLTKQIEYNDTVSADVAKAAVHMQELLTLQQFTMASVSNLLSQNLLQFLQ